MNELRGIPRSRFPESRRAIGESARARVLYCLMDGHARTSTELAMVAEVSPSTASVHLNRLKADRLVKILVQGKHRYYSLGGPTWRPRWRPECPWRAELGDPVCARDPKPPACGADLLRSFGGKGGCVAARPLQGTGVAVTIREPPVPIRCQKISTRYDVAAVGTKAFEALGIDIEATRALRRRFAYACLDWSERRPHLGGALGAAVLRVALKKKWLLRDLDSRALGITNFGRRELLARFGLDVRSDLRSDQ